jgi:UDP-N-acetylmuramoylalanine--D-glutamate ligase
MNKTAYQGKQVIVIGMARSGVGAAILLHELGAKVAITDIKPLQELTAFLDQLPEEITVYAGRYPLEKITSADLVVVSPGVPLDVPFLEMASLHQIPIISELELAYNIAKTPFIGITGTNGKTTTTTLVNQMLQASGFKTILCGNIGQSAAQMILEQEAIIQPDYIVAEISSFQLETIVDFKAHIALILNITPDHLDRHKTMEEYRQAKFRIFMNHTAQDYLILNANDPVLNASAIETKSMTSYFSLTQKTKGVYVDDGWIVYHFPFTSGGLLPIRDIPLIGKHNIENVMAAAAVALTAGCPSDSVAQAIRQFKALPHRMEPVATVNNIRFIDDSKGTNVDAVSCAIENFDNLILIMGGLDKDGDFTILKDSVRQRVKLIILIGRAADKIENALKGQTEIIRANSIEDAVAKAYAHAKPGDVALLSPGCASFDMFKDYKERGRRFKAAVLRL